MAKAWVLLALFVLLACGQPPGATPANEATQSAAANRAVPTAAQAGGPAEPQLVPFEPVTTPAARAAARRAAEAALVEALVLHRCTADRAWCAELAPAGEGWRLDIVERARAGAPERRVRHALPREPRDDPIYELWPSLVREPGGAVMVGLLISGRAGFSGGGAMATRLSLLRLEPGAAAPVAVLEVPAEGSAMVRACFSEDDMRRRREACHDEYELTGTLTLIPPRNGDAQVTRAPHGSALSGGQGGLSLDRAQRGGGVGTVSVANDRARFRFTTTARTYPGEVGRWEDSADRPPLAPRDLVWAADRACSYSRIFTFDPARGHYVPDAPLPDCGQYLVADA